MPEQSINISRSFVRFNARSGPQGRTHAALDDIIRGLRAWPFWTLIGWYDIKQRYRRTTLGPLWITISMGLLTLVLGVIYGSIFNKPIGDYLVYLSAGIITWFFVSSTVMEGSTVFIAAEGIIKQGSIPLSIHIYRAIWRNLIVLIHNVLVLIILFVLFRPVLSINLLLLPLGIFLLVANLLMTILILGLVSTRFRDIPQMIGSMMQVLFYITPILYEPSQLPTRIRLIALYNPVYHVIEVFREPLIGETPTLINYSVAISSMVIGGTIAFLLFRRFRARIAYWV